MKPPPVSPAAADPFAALDPLGRARRAFLGRASLGLGALALHGLGGCAATPAASAAGGAGAPAGARAPRPPLGPRAGRGGCRGEAGGAA
ncbi:MAG: hypothetical protein ACK548_11655, partial [Planctomycetota bacterium]